MRKAAFSLVLLASFSLVLPAFSIHSVRAAEDSWVSKAPMTEARANFGIAVVKGKIYAFGGDIGSPMGNAVPAESYTAETVNTTEEYDPIQNIWTFKKSMPTLRSLFGVAVYQNKVYCIGGYYGKYTFTDGVFTKTEYFNTGINEVYDPTTDTWETLTTMPVFERFATANTINGKIFVLNPNRTQVYDPPTDSWTTKAPPPYQIVSHVSAVVDNKIYVIGRFTNSSGSWTSVIQVYDPLNDVWSIGAESPTDGYSAAGATTGADSPKQIYFFDETQTNVYNPETDTWTTGTPMLSARVLARTAVIDDVFYVVGGRSGQHGYITMMHPNAANEQYIPIGYIPEFPSVTAMMLLLSVLVVAVTVYKVRLAKRLDQHIERCKF